MAKSLNYKRIVVTVTTAGTPVPISANAVFTPDFMMFVPSGNTGTSVYIGDDTVDNTWPAFEKGSAPGNKYNFTHGTGNWLGCDPVAGFDLSKLYIDADSNGDEVVIQYLVQRND